MKFSLVLVVGLTTGNAFHTPLTFGTSRRAVQQHWNLQATLEGETIEGEFAPTNNFLLVKVADDVEQSDGGIFLTGKAKKKKTEGIVVSVGPGRTNQETGFVFDMPLSPGETVLYGKYDGTTLNYNDAEHNLIQDTEVLVKFATEERSLDSADVLYDNVLVKIERKTEEEETSTGILIAETTKRNNLPSIGEVVKVGPGRRAANGVMMEMDVAVGDMVKFRDFAASEVEIGDEQFAVVRMTDILIKF